jgi:hypothetical protein
MLGNDGKFTVRIYADTDRQQLLQKALPEPWQRDADNRYLRQDFEVRATFEGALADVCKAADLILGSNEGSENNTRSVH